jgi:hypothetical protein
LNSKKQYLKNKNNPNITSTIGILLGLLVTDRLEAEDKKSLLFRWVLLRSCVGNNFGWCTKFLLK